jgi:hypothetical protein
MTAETESIKEPTNADELLAMHKMLRSDRQRYLRVVNRWIDENPNCSTRATSMRASATSRRLGVCARLPDDFWTPGFTVLPAATRPTLPTSCAVRRRTRDVIKDE